MSDETLLSDLIRKALAKGADAADALMGRGVSLSCQRRLGKVEQLERSEEKTLGLRVFVGAKQAVVSGADLNKAMLDELVERAVSMAKAVPDDPYVGLADPEQLLQGAAPDLDMVDAVEPEVETLLQRAGGAEEAAMSVTGVSNSQGAEASWGRTEVLLTASNGFSDRYCRTGHSVGVSVVAESAAGMETDYDWHSAVHGEDLEDPARVGRRAGERTVARLNPRKGGTAQVPVVLHPRVAGSLVGVLLSAINGTAVAKGTSFLKDRLGEQVMAEGISILEDPLRQRGLASRPFDAEGLPTTRKTLVDNGTLATWLLDLHTGRRLGMISTGNATRSVGGLPSPAASNVHLAAGTLSPKDLLADINSGFYVTSLMGMGVNIVTGDYSQGASGFWIEKGQRAHPVSEMTIAGNLRDMFLHLTAANDLEFRHGINAPTLRMEGMTVAGA